MAFKKGHSGNPAGKPKGAKNKTTLDLRQAINDFLNENFEKIKIDIDSLETKDRVKIYIELLQYGLPKLQTVQLNSNVNLEQQSMLNITIDREAIKLK